MGAAAAPGLRERPDGVPALRVTHAASGRAREAGDDTHPGRADRCSACPPPVGTEVVDDSGVALVEAFLATLTTLRKTAWTPPRARGRGTTRSICAAGGLLRALLAEAESLGAELGLGPDSELGKALAEARVSVDAL